MGNGGNEISNKLCGALGTREPTFLLRHSNQQKSIENCSFFLGEGGVESAAILPLIVERRVSAFPQKRHPCIPGHYRPEIHTQVQRNTVNRNATATSPVIALRRGVAEPHHSLKISNMQIHTRTQNETSCGQSQHNQHERIFNKHALTWEDDQYCDGKNCFYNPVNTQLRDLP